jgi:methyl-accepting chemotaxis protein
VREDFGDIALQCELMALNTMIETMHAGEAGKCFARQTAMLRSLSQLLNHDNKKIRVIGGTDNLLHEVQSRLDILSREQDDISALAAEISANSRRAIHALQFEDVESQVVVYSKDHAANPRALVAQIEARRSTLEAGIAASQDDLRSMTGSFQQQFEVRSSQSRQSLVCPASQNSLDHGDSEMF